MSVDDEKKRKAAEREARLAEALRANLHRRKAQKRARKAGPDAERGDDAPARPAARPATDPGADG